MEAASHLLVCSANRCRDGATQMVDDRALVLPQQETEASKEVHLGYLPRGRLSRMLWGHVCSWVTSSVPFLFARDTPDLSSASEVGVRGGE
jgi:hypothetical protein